MRSTTRITVFLADLVHDQVLGDNHISGGADFCTPLNIAGLAAYAKQKLGSSLDIRLFKYPNELIEAISAEKPDILGFSNYIWNLDLNSRIGAHVRERYPDVMMIMGGPSIRVDPNGICDFLRKNRFLDGYIMFEGERPFVDLLETWLSVGSEATRLRARIDGFARLVDDKLVYSPARTDQSLDDLPSPYLTGLMDPFLEAGFIPLFETNRGCPFSCSYCTWGITALNKIRRFPIERVHAELEYVASRYPNLPAWIIGDANFGLLPRDTEIANRIAEIQTRVPALRTVMTWESKNTTERNMEIAQALGQHRKLVLIAVQTLTPSALKAIHRDNIRFPDLQAHIDRFHLQSLPVGTHILTGLPDESFEQHLQSLRKCFDLGFDDIGIFSTILLPGCELDSEASRERHGIRTRYRLRQGMYGEYNGFKCMDPEEIISSHNHISEKEIDDLRPIHWMIWYGWNHGFLKPIFRYAHGNLGLNPVDLITRILGAKEVRTERVNTLLDEFARSAAAEWFQSPKDLRVHYTTPRRWADLMRQGYAKVEFRYTVRMLASRELFIDLLESMRMVLARLSSPLCAADWQHLHALMLEARIEPSDLFEGPLPERKQVVLPSPLAFCCDLSAQPDEGMRAVSLEKCTEEQDSARSCLKDFGFEKDPSYAIQKTLGAHPNAFLYSIRG